jgi:hypothetical protein
VSQAALTNQGHPVAMVKNAPGFVRKLIEKKTLSKMGETNM